ncbi:hypothetical protein LRAMOSA03237 [Lichtheimia ramosa]|uniref:RING-CH-type domain-containing protein n=1 Tax=Lichtheimia ramosa TaxID=688394 RepID=A0A077WVF0_9FUNG|nr:hypothetical protein LRAMOSA03237 [Lichtheimia ramosa]
MKPCSTDLSTLHFARDPAATQESVQSIFYSTPGGSLNHANLRRHLQPLSSHMSGTSSRPPPRLTRQDAFLREDTSSSDTSATSSDDTSAPIPRHCKICFSMTGPLIKSPCQCLDPPSYIHQACLIDMLSSIASYKHCCSCHSFYNPNMLSTIQQQQPTNDRGSFWKTLFIIITTTLIIETYRCTELQQIPGSELDEGALDYIWLPVVQHQCWQESLLAMCWRSMKSYPLVTSLLIVLIVVVIRILDKVRR